MAIAKENDLVSSIYIVKILYQEVLRYALLFAKCILYLDAQNNYNFIISL